MGTIFFTSEVFLSMVIAIFVKLLSPKISIELILLARYILCLPILFIFGFSSDGKNVLKIERKKPLIIRITAGFLGLLFWFLAVSRLEISTATVLLQTMVIFTTILASILLNERTSTKKWLAIMVGFLGTIILLNPTRPDWDGIGLLFGVAAPISAAIMFVYLRKLGQTERTISTALWYNLTCSILMIAWYFLFCSPEKLNTQQALFLLYIGLLSSFQQLALALSHKLSEASKLAPLNYLSIPLSILASYFIFEDDLDVSFFIGTIAIVYSAYMISIRYSTNKLNTL